MLRWGLIPSWYEGEIEGTPRAWVRCHRIERSKIYRAAWLDSQRCILPVAGFYAWQLTRDKYRQPFFVRLNDRSVFGIAAVWDRWVSEEDDVIESCSMIRVPTNSLMSEISAAADGMPALLLRKDYQTWLQGSPVEAGAVLQPYKPQWMQAYPVSPRVNSAAADDPSLIRIAS